MFRPRRSKQAKSMLSSSTQLTLREHCPDPRLPPPRPWEFVRSARSLNGQPMFEDTRDTRYAIAWAGRWCVLDGLASVDGPGGAVGVHDLTLSAETSSWSNRYGNLMFDMECK